MKGDRAMNRQQSHETEATGSGWVVRSPDLEKISLQFLASIMQKCNRSGVAEAQVAILDPLRAARR